MSGAGGPPARVLVVAAQRAAAKELVTKAAKKKETGKEELFKLASDAIVADPDPPTARRHLVNDFTVEKLGELMAQNPLGLTAFRDELTGLLKTLDKQGHEAARGFLLEAWNGTGSYTFDRIGRGTVHIPAACLASSARSSRARWPGTCAARSRATRPTG